MNRVVAAQNQLQLRADYDLGLRALVAAWAQVILVLIVGLATTTAQDERWMYAALCWFVVTLAFTRWALVRHWRHWCSRWPRLAVWTLHTNIAATALVWGLFVGFSVLRYGLDNWNTTILLVSLAAQTAGAIASLASHYPLLRFYLLALLGPTLMICLTMGNRQSYVVGGGLVVYLAYLLLQGRRLYAIYWNHLYDNAELHVKAVELDFARQAAEQASRAKSEFLANISHELRTPMHGVLGMTSLALESPLAPEQREYIQAARGSAESLLRLVNDVLDLTKIEAGKLTLEPEPFSPERFFRSLRTAFLGDLRERGLTMELHVDPRVPPLLEGDQSRLRQILVNLVGNSVKFTERGCIVVTVRQVERAEGRVKLHIGVTDTGIGIPAEHQMAIFDSFVQVDGTHTRRRDGAGLGLAISSRLVTLMGGRLWVESAYGLGSTFHIELPLEIAEPSAPPLARPEAGASRALRVLLAEDNKINQRLAQRILEKDGHSVQIAQNGREAVEVYAAGEFDVVLMDVQMPEMDGIEATLQIRSLERALGRKTPIVALTAGAMQSDREHCLAAGMDGYLAKPLRPEDLRTTVCAAAAAPLAS